jgi:azurin
MHVRVQVAFERLELLLSALAPSAVTAAADPPRTIDIVATDDMKYSFATIKARPGEQISSVIAKTALAGPGETVQITFVVPAKPGRYPFICTFAGHYQAGMKGTLVVK